jgi:hypothetical protein
MKNITLFFVVAILTVQVDAQIKPQQSKEQLNLDLVHAKKIKYAGLALTVTGAVATVGGYIMAKNGLDREYESTPGHVTNDTYSTTGGYIGVILVIVGIPVTCTGIPLSIAGSIKYHKTQKKLQISLVNIKSPYCYSSINGVCLKIRF